MDDLWFNLTEKACDDEAILIMYLATPQLL